MNMQLEPTPSACSCPVCGSRAVEEFLRRSVSPVHQNLLFSSAAAARRLANGTLRMHVCGQCGFVFNAAFDESLLEYGRQYDNTQTHSATFQGYVGQLVDRIARLPAVRQGTVVEVGCGKGGFLRQLLQAAGPGCQGHGFDPAYEGTDSDLQGQLAFHRCFYDERQASVPADAIVCRHVIEHIPRPLSLLRCVRQAARPQARVFFETPCAAWILRNQVVWDFFYEHCSLFTAASLAAAFERTGFRVESVEHVFGGQYLWLEAVADAESAADASDSDDTSDSDELDVGSNMSAEVGTDAWPPTLPFRAPARSWATRSAIAPARAMSSRVHKCCSHPIGDDMRDRARHFAVLEGSLVERWQRQIKSLARQGGVVLWGAGAKGVTFANLVDPDRRWIAGVVDVNPNKQGRFLPGSAHRILAPEALSGLPVTSALLLNPNYGEEVSARLRRLGLGIRVVDLMREQAAKAA